MELMWNDSDFSGSLKSRLGVVDADIAFVRLKPFVRQASEEVVEIVGQAAYDVLCNRIADNSLRQQLQQVILLNALLQYLKVSDISITNNGRKRRADEHEGTLWEWEVDKSNREWQALYYRQLDVLLRAIVREGFALNMAPFNHQNFIVPTLSDFERHFSLNGSYHLFLKLLPALAECEDFELSPRIGSVPANLFTPEMKLLAQKACVFYALDWGLRRLNIQLFPEGVFQTAINTGGTKKSSPDKLQYLETAMLFKKDSLRYLQQLELRVQQLSQMDDPFRDRVVIDPGIRSWDDFIDT